MLKSILESKYGRIIRYLISGGTAAAIDIGLLYLFVKLLHFWYLGSAVAAFIITFAASFLLQKFFTFKEDSRERVPVELSTYLFVSLINLGLNTLGMYLCVGILHVHYLAAQFIVNGILAVYSYFIYKYFVFYPLPHEKN